MGFAVPEEVLSHLGAGNGPAVRVTLGRHTYRTTIARRGGRCLIPLSAENRAAAGVTAGDEVDVHIEADTGPREVDLPADLAEALAGDQPAREFFEMLAYTHRKEWARWVGDAKRPETRTSRLATTLESLRAGKSTR